MFQMLEFSGKQEFCSEWGLQGSWELEVETWELRGETRREVGAGRQLSRQVGSNQNTALHCGGGRGEGLTQAWQMELLRARQA